MGRESSATTHPPAAAPFAPSSNKPTWLLPSGAHLLQNTYELPCRQANIWRLAGPCAGKRMHMPRSWPGRCRSRAALQLLP